MMVCRLIRFLMEAGMEPVRLFEYRTTASRLTRLPMESGMEPLRLFEKRARTCRWTRLPMEVGMEPVRLFESRSRTVTLTRFPMDCGIVPVRLHDESSSFTTALREASHTIFGLFPVDHGDDESHGSVSFHVDPIQQSLFQYGPPVSSHRSRSACTVDGGTAPRALSTDARASSNIASAMVVTLGDS